MGLLGIGLRMLLRGELGKGMQREGKDNGHQRLPVLASVSPVVRRVPIPILPGKSVGASKRTTRPRDKLLLKLLFNPKANLKWTSRKK
jgi:hypothetical protein